MGKVTLSFPKPPKFKAAKITMPKLGMPRTSKPSMPRSRRYSPAINKKNL